MAELVPDYKKASNLIRLSAALMPFAYLANYLLFKETVTFRYLTAVYIMLAILFVTALLVRSEVKWIKWPYLILIGIGMTFDLLSAMGMTVNLLTGAWIKGSDLRSGIVNGMFSVTQNLLGLYALFLLFVPNKKIDIEDGSIVNTGNVV
jgi:hypothetical protein